VSAAPSTRIALAPEGARGWLGGAVTSGGGELVAPEDADALVWALPSAPDELGALLDANPKLRWVQLPWAGIEPYVEVVAAHPERIWTCGKGVYAEPVAEMALTLLLAGFRGFATYGRATSWGKPQGRNLLGAHVVVAGGGGIAESLLRLLGPFGCRTTVVRRRPDAVPGADRVVALDQLDAVLGDADALVLALALTPETEGLLDRARLDCLGPHGWLVNVARGRHVVTDDLVAALTEGTLGGAGLDVTDPEPLPDDHPLWSCPNLLVTPHVGNTPEMAVPLLSARITDNVRRWIAGEALVGLVDPALGY
jgi:phosphoglycerate dehydrogenase-like enzyme